MVKAQKILNRSKSRGGEKEAVDNINRDEGIKMAISWFLQNNCTSNVQLAIISNVCRGWRQIASDAVASEALDLAANDKKNDSVSEKSSAVGHCGRTNSTLRTLLVTDMARGLVIRQKRLVDNRTCGSFCLAWFAPSGIQLTSVSLDDNDDGDAESRSSRKVTCCIEWRGYSHATEVLIPIGYATSFVHGVFEATSKLAFGDVSSPIMISSLSSQKLPSHRYNTTFSVRGATLARPEGFCLCVDDDYIEHTNSASFQTPPHASFQRTPSCADEWMLDYIDDDQWPLREDSVLSSSQRLIKRRDLGRVLLPRVVMSTRRKYPLLHRFAETDEDCKSMKQINRLPRLEQINARGSPHKHLPFEKRQRAVQFLNSDRSQAVRMITPKFDCGPVTGPITAFIVAISTEDGCFLSGRSCRYEFGHMVSFVYIF
jgi:hypothetical protein